MFKATILVDNIAHGGCKAEWGFSVHICYGGRTYLLDTGSTALYLENAKKLGVSIAEVDTAVLSHAHCDHAGGFPSFFRENGRASLFVSPCCQEDCYFKLGPIRKYVGVPRGMLSSNRSRITAAENGTQALAEGVWLIQHLPAGLEAIGKRAHMYRKAEGCIVPDDFSHEQSLVFETDKGLVVLNSCSHAGLDSIVRDVQHALPGKPIYMTIGGMHLAAMRPAAVRRIAQTIRTLDIAHVVTGHCTGKRAFAILREELGDTVQQTCVGQVIEV